MGRAGSGTRVGALAVAGVLVGTVLAGCGDDSGSADRTEGAAAQGGADAQEQGTRAVRSAYDKTSEEDTARVTLRVRTSAEDTSITADGRGTIDLEDGDSVMTVTVQGQRVEQRVVDQVLYQKMPKGQAPGDKPWIRIDLNKVASRQGAGDQSMSDPARSAAFAKAITDKDVTEKGTDTIDGVKTTRYRVTVDVAKLPHGAALRQQVGPTLPMEVWLDEQGRIRRQQWDMTLKTPMPSSERPSADSSAAPQQLTVRTVMGFSDFGTELEAEAPPAGQVTDMTGKAARRGSG
ncbi:DUF7537 family lipoprotein [Streptomyces bullii]|uniref:Lipoprotein n=1 Tax=Streptomyces bullii TaxID=349910 RepID=A0ABW0UZ67_9ACTN